MMNRRKTGRMEGEERGREGGGRRREGERGRGERGGKS